VTIMGILYNFRMMFSLLDYEKHCYYKTITFEVIVLSYACYVPFLKSFSRIYNSS